MPTLNLGLSAEVPAADLQALQADLASYGDVQQLPAKTFDPLAVMMVISFWSDVVQGVDVLVNWLKRTPGTNQATIRFADGRTITYEDDDPDAFRRALVAALE